MIALSPVEGLKRDCAEVGEKSIAVHGGWSGLDVARTPCRGCYGGNGLPCRWAMVLRWIVQSSAQPGMVVASVRWWMTERFAGVMVGVIRHFGRDFVHFLRLRMIRNRWLCVMTDCFRMTFGGSRGSACANITDAYG